MQHHTPSHELDLSLVEKSGWLWDKHSKNPMDRWLSEETITATNIAGEGHITWVYIDTSTSKTMILRQWDGKLNSYDKRLIGQQDNGSIVVELDSDDHWKLCDSSMYFRWTSITPKWYYDPHHPRYEGSHQALKKTSSAIFGLLWTVYDELIEDMKKLNISG